MNILPIVIIAFLSSCDVIYKPIRIANAGINDLIVETKESYSAKRQNKYHETESGNVEYHLQIGQISVEESDLEKANYRVIKQITFYQKDKSCPLFSYTREQLLDLKTKAGFAEKDYNVIFLIEENGLRPISKKDYSKMRLNTDISLKKELSCKQL